MAKLDGKVALITGAGSGIGRASALIFAEEGAKVGVADCDSVGGQKTVDMIRGAAGEAIFIETDVTKAADVERMVKTAVDAYGRIDILYNNAGIIGPVAPTADLTEEDWDLVLDTDLKSVFLGSKYTIPVMLEQGGGVIVSTSSTMGLAGKTTISHYSAAKAGIIALTRSMAAEYARQNIRVNCICPGMIETAMTESWIPQLQIEFIPLGEKCGRAEDVARAALYLACDDSAYVSGIALVIDGAWTAEAILPFRQAPAQ